MKPFQNAVKGGKMPKPIKGSHRQPARKMPVPRSATFKGGNHNDIGAHVTNSKVSKRHK